MNISMIRPSTAFALSILALEPEEAPLTMITSKDTNLACARRRPKARIKLGTWVKKLAVGFALFAGIGLISVWGWVLIQMVQLLVLAASPAASPVFTLLP